MEANLQTLIDEYLRGRESANQMRRRRVLVPIDAVHAELDSRRVINFASNNYLGLTHHPRIVEAAKSALDRFGGGSASAGLITGYTELHEEAEAAIANWKGVEAAVLLPSGYQANHAAVQMFASLGAEKHAVRFLLDKLVHASLVDAVRAADRPFRVLPHNGIEKLKRLLEADAGRALQVVVTESIFSMDGDAADLRAIAELKRDHDFALLLDEAHASGVYGPDGAGLAAEMGLGNLVDLTVITLSKSFGCIGGAVCGSRAAIDAVVNAGRAYIYSTSIPPFVCAAVIAAIEVMKDEPRRQARVRRLAKDVRQRLTSAGLCLPPGDSPIIPVILGDEGSALSASQKLLEMGLLVPAVRPPTVPRGQSRLRITLSCDHGDDEIDVLIKALTNLP